MLSKIFENVELYFLDHLMGKGGSPHKKMTDKERITFLQDLVWKLHYDVYNENGNKAGKEFHQQLLTHDDVKFDIMKSL